MGLYARLSVHELVDPLFRSGDLDDRIYNQETMAEGSRIHSKYQKKQRGDYLSEYPLECTIEAKLGTVYLFGRADGIKKDGNSVSIEEVKSTVADLDEFFAAQERWHLSQAQCYAYMYCRQNKLPQAEIKLVYISQLKEGETMDKGYLFSFAELEEAVFSMVDLYLARLAKEKERKDKRNESALSFSFPFSAFRRGQKELAKYCYALCLKGGRMFAEAPTGIGKTMSVLYPAGKAFAKGQLDKVFYLTAKGTGAEIAEKTARILIEKGLKIRVSSLLAKEKACLLPGHSCNPDDCPFAKDYYGKLSSCLAEARERSSFFTRAEFAAYCREKGICPFEFQLDLSEYSDLIIADYNYLFDPFVRLERYFGSDSDPTDDFALIDEAHNLVERGRSMYGAKLGAADAYFASLSLEKGKWSKVKRAIGKVRKALEEECAGEEELGFFASFPASIQKAIEGLQRVLLEKRKKEGGGMPPRARDFVRECSRIGKLLEGYVASCPSAFKLIKGTAKHPSIELFCLDPSSFLSASLSRLKGALLFSATLSPLPYYEEAIFARHDTPSLVLPSPFPRERMKLLIAPNLSTRYKDREQSADQLAEYLHEFVSAKVGNYFIFFPSYEYLHLLEGKLSFPGAEVYAQSKDMGEEARLELLSVFAPNPRVSHVALLVLGGTFAEGIDLPSDRLIGVAVVGVGLPQVNFTNELIKEQKGEDGFDFAYKHPGMNKVMQALGRLIRSEEDSGAALLIDDRYLHADYRALLSKRYPDYQLVRSKGDIRRSLTAFYKKIDDENRK